jgi:hypothetical protein
MYTDVRGKKKTHCPICPLNYEDEVISSHFTMPLSKPTAKLTFAKFKRLKMYYLIFTYSIPLYPFNNAMHNILKIPQVINLRNSTQPIL